MIDYYKILDDIEGHKDQELILLKDSIEKDIKVQIDSFAADTEQLFQFAYHLR